MRFRLDPEAVKVILMGVAEYLDIPYDSTALGLRIYGVGRCTIHHEYKIILLEEDTEDELELELELELDLTELLTMIWESAEDH